MQLPDDYLPGWARVMLGVVLGAGGVHWFRAWLEDRRLVKKEFRDVMMDRIRELELDMKGHQKLIGSLRADVARLEAENRHLSSQLGSCRDEHDGF